MIVSVGLAAVHTECHQARLTVVMIALFRLLKDRVAPGAELELDGGVQGDRGEDFLQLSIGRFSHCLTGLVRMGLKRAGETLGEGAALAFPRGAILSLW